MRQLEKDYKRIVVKIGSSLFYSSDNVLDDLVVYDICRQITRLVRDGKEVVIVSSGAIAFGMNVLGLIERPNKLEDLQATAAVGQNELMNAYRKFFGKDWFGAQILLTWEDFANRKRYLNAKNTVNALLQKRKYRMQSIVPIINENDTISTEEIKFGDNDKLSALVSNLISADLLIILSDVDGLLEKDRKTVRRIVYEINQEIKELACPTDKKICVGGMSTKIEAAKIAIDSGIPCVVANGKSDNIILRILKGPNAGDTWTLFVPKKGSLSAKKRWIVFGAKTKGKIRVDAGAKLALINKKSLLSVGVIDLEGSFESGDIVSILDLQRNEFGRGRVSISNKQLDKVKGRRFDKEVIHRDNIVILTPDPTS